MEDGTGTHRPGVWKPQHYECAQMRTEVSLRLLRRGAVDVCPGPKAKGPRSRVVFGFPTPRLRVYRACLRGRTASVFALRPSVEEPSLTPLNAKREARRDAQWMKLARAHDPLLYLHCILVSELCASFSAFLNLSRDLQLALTRAGLLHDIGKLKIPAAILCKPSLLTAEEMTLMQEHTQHGYDMLLAADETDELLLTVIRDHHERLDGSGYPRKLTALEISTPVRIVTLCDVFAAMTEPRRYGTVMRWDEALARMAKKRTRLDLVLLADFATMMTEIHEAKNGSVC